MPKPQTMGLKRIESKIRPVVKTSISDEIVEQIISLISKGDLKPGQRLPSERELCKNFGAGRSSLREALRCLCIVGVLNARVGEGTSVAVDGGKFLGKIVEWRVMTEQHDIENLMEVRIALEGVTAASAALRCDEKDLLKIDALMKRMEAATKKDEKQFAPLDLEFHVTLAEASQNFLIVDLIAMIRGQLEKALSRVLLLPNARPLSFKEHVAIVNAIKRHDPEAAREAMQIHLDAALKRYHNALGSEHVAIAGSKLRKTQGGRSKSGKASRHIPK
jgi:GntR family transcriptional regulator, transcriptional repressor for pyruvate dehydrogenase complex